jgi:hypothetical protein
LGKSFGIDELVSTLEADTVPENGWLRGESSTIYSSDLMNDILSFSIPNSLLLMIRISFAG